MDGQNTMGAGQNIMGGSAGQNTVPSMTNLMPPGWGQRANAGSQQPSTNLIPPNLGQQQQPARTNPSGNGSAEMTEEEMIQEAIRRSLEEQ